MMASSSSTKDSLVLELRESMDSTVRLLQLPTASEDVRRDCATQILNSVVTFLCAWDKLDDDTTGFPSGIVRDALSRLLSEVGPGDANVRATLLGTVSSVSSADCRLALLVAMPWTMPLDEEELEEATQSVLVTLREVLLRDPEALQPVLKCLSQLPLSVNGRAEAWNLALTWVPVVSEADLPVLVRELLCHVTQEEDASRALIALRTELELVESAESADSEEDSDHNDSDDPIPLIADVLLGAFCDREIGTMIAKAYRDILIEMSPDDEEDGDARLVVDVVAILALHQNQDFRSEVEAVMDAWIKAESFPFAVLDKLLKIISVRNRPGEPASVLYDRLVPPLLSLGVFLLLAPTRIGTSIGCSTDVHQFLLEFHHRVDRDNQERLVRCLLHLSDETLWNSDESNKRSRKRSRKHIGKAAKREGLAMTTVAVYSLLQDLVQTARSSVTPFKQIIIQRFTSAPTESLVDALSSTKHLCTILSCLVEPQGEEQGSGSGIDASEVMILLQRLLFTSSYSTVRRSLDGESMADVGRVTRGLLLATELIHSAALIVGDKDCIYQWVRRILLPSTRRTVDPEIGSQGLRFLAAWSTWRESVSSNGMTASPAQDEQLVDMFQNFKMILANTALIQMLAPYLEGRNRPKDVVLGYTKVPAPFLINADLDSDKNKRAMIFCVRSFLRTNTVQHPSRWGHMVKWVYDLVDTYLAMGREGTSSSGATKSPRRTKWRPDGWLQASIELPSLNLAVEKTDSKTEASTESLSSVLCSHEVSFKSISVLKTACKDVSYALCCGKTVDQITETVEGVLRVTLSFILAMGLSAAVLRNTYAHLVSVGKSGHGVAKTEASTASRRTDELVKLMQYQLMKMYDLKRKAAVSVRLLRALDREVRKEYEYMRQDEWDEDTLRKASRLESTIVPAIERTELALSRIYDTNEFFQPEILLKCLLDTNDDAVVMASLRRPPRDSSTALHFNMIARLRRDLLDHLCTVFHTSATDDGPDDNNVACLSTAMRMAADVSKLLPTFREEVSTGQDEEETDQSSVVHWDESAVGEVSALASSYFRFVKTVLINAKDALRSTVPRNRKRDELAEEKKCDGDATAQTESTAPSDLFAQWVASVTAGGRKSDEVSLTPTQNGYSLTLPFDALLEHLRICEDEASALEVLEMLSILSSNQAGLTRRTLGACWRVLHTVYTVSCRDESTSHEPPHVFAEAMSQTASTHNSSTTKEDKSHLVERAISGTIGRTATNSAKNFQENPLLRRVLLLIWGLEAQSSSSTRMLGFDYLSKLTDELESFLDDINGTMLLSSDGNNQDDRSERRKIRASKNRPYASSLPSLTTSSLDVFFELVLHMAVAAFAVSPHAKRDNEDPEGDEDMNPFEHLGDMAQLFSRLWEGYSSNVTLFSRRTLSTALGACRHMLNLYLYHTHGCVRWRNEQPLLSAEQKRAGVHDYGSIRYLDQLLQSFATWGVGEIMTLGQTLQSRFVSAPDSDDSEGEQNEIQDKRFTSLLSSAQRTLEALGSVASAHNLVPPTVENVSDDKTSTKKQRTGLAQGAKGHHEPGSSEAVDDPETDDNESAKKKQRLAPTLASAQTAPLEDHDNGSDGDVVSNVPQERRRPAIHEEDDAYDWASSASSDSLSSEAFGVSGKWGDDDEMASNDDESSGSLELQVSDIFQAR